MPKKVKGPLASFIKQYCVKCELKCAAGSEMFTNCLMAAMLESLDVIYEELFDLRQQNEDLPRAVF